MSSQLIDRAASPDTAAEKMAPVAAEAASPSAPSPNRAASIKESAPASPAPEKKTAGPTPPQPLAAAAPSSPVKQTPVFEQRSPAATPKQNAVVASPVASRAASQAKAQESKARVSVSPGTASKKQRTSECGSRASRVRQDADKSPRGVAAGGEDEPVQLSAECAMADEQQPNCEEQREAPAAEAAVAQVPSTEKTSAERVPDDDASGDAARSE